MGKVGIYREFVGEFVRSKTLIGLCKVGAAAAPAPHLADAECTSVVHAFLRRKRRRRSCVQVLGLFC